MSKRSFPVWVCIAICIAVAAWHFGPQSLDGMPRTESHAPAAAASRSTEPISPIPAPALLDARKVALGGRLFHDPRLSGDDSVACASCHALGNGGADGAERSKGIRAQLSDFNAPSVYNSALNFRQFWNGRTATLEEQIDGPVHGSGEMGTSWPHILAKLQGDEGYEAEFAALYGGMRAEGVRDAIATFERSLTTPDSRFDRYLKGDNAALTAQELEGYRRFQSYGCVACHQGVGVGGNMYARLGVALDYFNAADATAPANQGRFAVTGRQEDLHVFKVPSLRNVALTAPYLHNGSASTLEDAVQVMGTYQLGVAIPVDDVELLVAFLQTLTGQYNGKPL